MTVVGVAKDVRHFGLDTEARREIFRPYSQAVWPHDDDHRQDRDRTRWRSPAACARRWRASIPISRSRASGPWTRSSRSRIGSRRFPMLLLALFSAVALVLAAIGVYGVVSYVVSQRTREIGIRMALGARAAQVIRLVLQRSLVPIGAGIVAGIAGSLAASRLLTALLYHVEPGDPGVLGAIVVLLTAPARSRRASCRRAARRQWIRWWY